MEQGQTEVEGDGSDETYVYATDENGEELSEEESLGRDVDLTAMLNSSLQLLRTCSKHSLSVPFSLFLSEKLYLFSISTEQPLSSLNNETLQNAVGGLETLLKELEAKEK